MPFQNASPPGPIKMHPDYGVVGLGPEHATIEHLAQRFDTERTWWLATTRPDRRPHTMPVWGVTWEHQLIFSTGPVSVKGRNLAANNAIMLHLESGDDVAILEARAELIEPATLTADFVATYEAKYDFAPDPADPKGAFFVAQPIILLAWNESRFAETAARWTFGI